MVTMIESEEKVEAGVSGLLRSVGGLGFVKNVGYIKYWFNFVI